MSNFTLIKRTHLNCRCPHVTINDVNCVTGKLKIEQECHCNSECSILATNANFGDPCNFTYKYVNITYFCIEAEGTIILNIE